MLRQHPTRRELVITPTTYMSHPLFVLLKVSVIHCLIIAMPTHVGILPLMISFDMV